MKMGNALLTLLMYYLCRYSIRIIRVQCFTEYESNKSSHHCEQASNLLLLPAVTANSRACGTFALLVFSFSLF